MNEYPIVPGRGLVTQSSTEERWKYLQSLGIEISEIKTSQLQLSHISRNIEAYVGSVEIPLGLAGPLKYNHSSGIELVQTAVATLEGALVASMNRGAKAVSLSGGFHARVAHQKMIRCPMFIFENAEHCQAFSQWLINHQAILKNEAERHSNHAILIELTPVISGNSVHIYYVYTTGDASGQNMTTTCTWHSILLAKDLFYKSSGIEPLHFVIEGNGASDKKVSSGNINRGRGINVKAYCELKDDIIQKILRTTSDNLYQCYLNSFPLTQKEGMVGYNINVSNTIASVFAATGQDLGSVHESSVGILTMKKTAEGLHFELTLPNLVIGTVGGGTHLPKQKEILQMMQCHGAGKVNRFAEIIAGFALSLEVSTFSAIVGGQFAKAHEKLGRNKPVNWLTRSEIDLKFVQAALHGTFPDKQITEVKQLPENLCDNGIIISLTNKINRKLTGFLTLELNLQNNIAPSSEKVKVLMKSKPLDTEVIKGLHLMASAVNPDLATMLYDNSAHLEYVDCHKKELLVNQLLRENKFSCYPALFGIFFDQSREIYLMFTELLEKEKLEIYNSENYPESWSQNNRIDCIKAITEVHQFFMGKQLPPEIKAFEPWKAKELYRKLAEIIVQEYEQSPYQQYTQQLFSIIEQLKSDHDAIQLPKTLIHNDFNTRNIAIRNNGEPCFYDWELSVLHFPHRDIVEFLSFTLPLNFEESQFLELLNFHSGLYAPQDQTMWNMAYKYCLKEYITTRLSFYLTGKIVLDFSFTEHIINNSFRMMEILSKRNTI
jgi:hydroxymethylglutaryl-CoA reductase (NADPH)